MEPAAAIGAATEPRAPLSKRRDRRLGFGMVSILLHAATVAELVIVVTPPLAPGSPDQTPVELVFEQREPATSPTPEDQKETPPAAEVPAEATPATLLPELAPSPPEPTPPPPEPAPPEPIPQPQEPTPPPEVTPSQSEPTPPSEVAPSPPEPTPPSPEPAPPEPTPPSPELTPPPEVAPSPPEPTPPPKPAAPSPPEPPRQKPPPPVKRLPPRPTARSPAESPTPRAEPMPRTSAPSPAPAPAPTQAAAVDSRWAAAISGWLSSRKIYPEEARRRGEEGNVSVRFTVDRSGHVMEATIVAGSGSALLDEAALNLLRQAVFPAFPASMPHARVTITTTIRYSLR